MVGELLIQWTARFAVACYAARLICDLSGCEFRTARWWWTAGCAWFVIHVGVSFHFKHGWNHAAAFAHTAQRTFEMTGWNSGIGLYINEAFLLLWIVDTVLWWKDIDWPNRRYVYWTVQGVFAFLVFQSTVVFGPTFWKPAFIMFLVCALSLALRSVWQRQRLRCTAIKSED